MSRVERLYNDEKEKPVRRQPKAGRRALGIIGRVLMVFVVAACLSLVIPRFAGYDAYVVVSGSMEPNIPVGSLVYSHKEDPASLQAGDVIVFVDPARGTTPITHRIVENDPAAGTIITKGDANENRDVNPAAYDNVLGKVVLHIPRMGFIAAMLTSTLGKVITVLLLLEAWLLIEISRRSKSAKKQL